MCPRGGKGAELPSDHNYLQFILEQLSDPDVSYRAMMGEFILYCRGKIAGGIYDNRLLVKPLPSAAALLPAAPRVKPYEGAKEMLLVEAVDDSAFLKELFANIADEAPAKRKKGRFAAPIRTE